MRAGKIRTLAFLSLLYIWAPAAGAETPASATVPFPIGSKFSRGIQTVTGINWLTEHAVGMGAGMVLRHKLGGKVKVSVKTFSLTDLLAGKIKSADVQMKGCEYKRIPLGHIDVATKNPVWYPVLHLKGQKPDLKVPVMLDVQAQLSQKEVEKALATKEVTSSLRGLKLDLPGLGEQQLEVTKPKVELGNNDVKVNATLITQGASEDTGVPLALSAKPELVGDRKIVLRNMKVESSDIVEPEKFAGFMEKLLNPVVDFARMDRKDHAFRLQSLEIKGGVAEGKGTLLLVPKNKVAAVATVQAN